MQGLWYGDRRDRVKWGALAYLVRRFRCKSIFQIAYFREERKDRNLRIADKQTCEMSGAVWDHFANLKGIERLGRGLGIRIRVFDEEFAPAQRGRYMEEALHEAERQPRPRLLFLDPDTGFAAEKTTAKHATPQDIKVAWSDLTPGEILAVYQHAARRKGWADQAKGRLEECVGSAVNCLTGTAAADVAIMWAQKEA